MLESVGGCPEIPRRPDAPVKPGMPLLSGTGSNWSFGCTIAKITGYKGFITPNTMHDLTVADTLEKLRASKYTHDDVIPPYRHFQDARKSLIREVDLQQPPIARICGLSSLTVQDYLTGLERDGLNGD